MMISIIDAHRLNYNPRKKMNEKKETNICIWMSLEKKNDNLTFIFICIYDDVLDICMKCTMCECEKVIYFL